MEKKVLSVLSKHNLANKNTSFIIGVSGGPDSVCLLYILNLLSLDIGFKIYAVHVNHMLRGEESFADQNYVKYLCEELNITLYIEQVNISEISKSKKISLEEAGREERYRIFNFYLDKMAATNIAVGHNKNDSVETIFLNIIRGTGLNGLKGIELKNGNIIRPLIDITREEIELYCIQNNLHPRTDSSNLNDIYTRNKVRNKIIPTINSCFGVNIIENISRMSNLIKDEVSFLEDLSRNLYKSCIVEREDLCISIDIIKFNNLHISLKRRVLREIISDLKGNFKKIESIHIENIINLCQNSKTGSVICLFDGIRAKKTYNLLKVFFEDNTSEDCFNINEKLVVPGVTYVRELDIYFQSNIVEKAVPKLYSKKALVQHFDYNKIKDNLIVRTRSEGDLISPLGFKGTKKLKKYFIDCKIDKEIRDKIPVLAINNEIIWIVGYNISDKFKVTEDTTYVLEVKLEKL